MHKIMIITGSLFGFASCSENVFLGSQADGSKPVTKAAPESMQSDGSSKDATQRDARAVGESSQTEVSLPQITPLPDPCADFQSQTLIPFRASSVWRYVVFPYTYPSPPTPFASLPARTNQGNAPFGYGYDEVVQWKSAVQLRAEGTQIALEVKFNLPTPTGLRIRLKYDNGAVAYLNGKEIFRNWLAEGISASSVTTRHVCDPAMTVAGENSFVLNVEDHGVISYADAQIESLK